MVEQQSYWERTLRHACAWGGSRQWAHGVSRGGFTQDVSGFYQMLACPAPTSFCPSPHRPLPCVLAMHAFWPCMRSGDDAHVRALSRGGFTQDVSGFYQMLACPAPTAIDKSQPESVNSAPNRTALSRSRVINAAPVGEKLSANGRQIPARKCQLRPERDCLEQFQSKSGTSPQFVEQNLIAELLGKAE